MARIVLKVSPEDDCARIDSAPITIRNSFWKNNFSPFDKMEKLFLRTPFSFE